MLDQNRVSDLIRAAAPDGVAEECPMGYGNTWTARHGAVCVTAFEDDEMVMVGVYPGDRFTTGAQGGTGFADFPSNEKAAEFALEWLGRMHAEGFDPDADLPPELSE